MYNYSMHFNDVENKHFISIPVPGDGSCLFYSLSYLMFGKNINHANDVQRLCCDHIIANSEYFSSFIQNLTITEYVSNLRKTITYGDHIEIFCAPHLYNRNFWVYEIDQVRKRNS